MTQRKRAVAAAPILKTSCIVIPNEQNPRQHPRHKEALPEKEVTIDSMTTPVARRESLTGFRDPAPPKTETPPRKQSRDSWRIKSLNREFETAVAAVGSYHLRMLACAGISGKIIKRLPFGIIGFVRAEICDRYYPIPKGYHRPSPQTGWPLYVIPAFDEFDRIVDLVGFHFAQPRKFWLRTGHGYCLGDPGSSILHVDITEFVKDGAYGCFPLTVNND